jgi:two-component system response regulator PilR (NtrC family)
MARLLIVDDEASMREFLEILLIKEGHSTVTAASGEEAMEILESEKEFDLVLTDLKMSGATGIDVLRCTKDFWPDTQVVVMTAFSTPETAVEAMKLGAYDYLPKPSPVEEIRAVVDRALEKRRLRAEVVRLKGQLQKKHSFANLIGRSSHLQKVFHIIEKVANSRTSVLISGESGTGKELVAKAIHYNSPRKGSPFVVVNCGAIPENLMESEFFGHVKGAFTGAVANKPGLLGEAHGGSIFLDEIGELPLSLQVKLLRVLQERRVKPVGGTHETAVDIRVIAATNKRLEDEVKEGRFREDLFYRLNVIQIPLPPLRVRHEDIPILAEHFLGKFSNELDREVVGFDAEVLHVLTSYPYPGNVRELENIIERAVTFETSNVITLESLPIHVVDHRKSASGDGGRIVLTEEGLDLEGVLGELERDLLLKALAMRSGVRTDAAKLLGISFRSIRYKLDKYGITDEDLPD